MDGDVFIFIKENDVCMCATVLHEVTIASYFYQLFRNAKLNPQAMKFLIKRVADIKKINLLKEKKIATITINAALYQASNNLTAQKGRAKAVTGIAGRYLNGLLGKENDVTNDSVMVSVTLHADGRLRKNLSLGEHRLEKWAEDLVKHQEKGDDFQIVTRDGQIISPDELRLQKISNIKTKGKSVDRDDAWKELFAFYEELCDSGAIDT